MSCHTWCAKKVDRSIVDARKLWIAKRRKWIKDWQSITYNVLCDENGVFMMEHPSNEFRSIYPEYTQEKCIWFLKLYKRQLRMVEKGLCNVAVMNDQPEHSYYRPGKGFFVNLPDHGNQFRIGNYPEDWLYSREECAEFIEKNKDKIRFYDNTEESLNDFWTKYPDGSIHFG